MFTTTFTITFAKFRPLTLFVLGVMLSANLAFAAKTLTLEVTGLEPLAEGF